MNRIAKAQYILSSDLARVASIVRQYGAAMGMDSDVREDFGRRCAAIARFAEDFDASGIGEPSAPEMPADADSDDQVLSYFDQDEFSTVKESEGLSSGNETIDRVASRLANRYIRSATGR